jgi:hypothetical protein
VFQVMKIEDLVLGDIVRRFVDKRMKLPPAEVMEICDFPGDAVLRPRRTVIIRIRSRTPRFKTFNNAVTSRVRILRPGECGELCCELHAREVDDGLHYCANHWRAWEAVA